MSKLRLAFMGAPALAARILAALSAPPHDIACVYAQPARPAGRGHHVTPSPVEELACVHDLPIETPTRFDAEAVAKFAALRRDVAVVAAYGLILPAAALAAPRLGCINVHASLLPRWRGAAPIERAILAGDRETGISIMQMEAGLDTGPVLLAERVKIDAATRAGALHDQLAEMGAALLLKALDRLPAGALKPAAQPYVGATYAKKLKRAEGELDWRLPAADLARALRAFELFPGSYFTHGGERIRVLDAEVVASSGHAAPGTVLDDNLTIACGAGALRLTRLQRAGRAAMDAAAFLRGCPLPPGTLLPCPATS